MTSTTARAQVADVDDRAHGRSRERGMEYELTRARWAVRRGLGRRGAADATTAVWRPQPRSRRREVREQDHSGVEPLHVVELHPDRSPVAEHVDVSLAP